MEKRLPHKKTLALNGPLPFTLLFILCGFTCASGIQVIVPEKVNAVLGKNITLGCRIEEGSNLTQSSWQRHLRSGPITIAVFNPEFGISISQEYAKRVSFLSPSVHDATIILEGVGFADIGSYTCKVSTFPLGNYQASTTVNVLVEPKVYVLAGPTPLLDGDAESVVATCIAERGRPAATVSWETSLDGRSEPATQDEANGTATVLAHYVWRPQSHAQGQSLTCVVRHPALPTDFRIPFALSVQFAPVVRILENDKNWYVGQKDVRLECGAKANPPARNFTWMRMDGPMPNGVVISNYSFAFTRPLDRNDSGVYRCEVLNDIGLRSQDVHLWIQEPPPTTAAPTTAASLHREAPGNSTALDRRRAQFTSPTLASLPDSSPIGYVDADEPPPTTAAPTTAASLHREAPGNSTALDRRRAQFTSPTLASLPDSSLGTIVGRAVGGVLFLALLLILGAACFMRQRRTFRGDYYTKQYLGPSDMQKEAQLDVLQPHELQEVYRDKGSGGGGKGSSQDLKPKPGGDVIYPEYPNERKDRDDWGGHRAGDGHTDEPYYPEHYKDSHNVHPCGPPVHSATVNGSPYLPEDCYYV